MSRFVSIKKALLGLLFIALAIGSYPLFRKEGDFISLPLLFFPNDPLPYLEGTIEGKKHLLLVDLGWCDPFALTAEAIQQLQHKEKNGFDSFYDANGKKYGTYRYFIDPVSFGKITFSDMSIREEAPSFHLNGALTDPSLPTPYATPHDGRIGAPIFRTCPFWYFDFKNHSIYILKNFDALSKHPFFPRPPWIEADLEQIEPHFVIKIVTPFGEKKFALDSGTSGSLLRTPEGFEAGTVKVAPFKIGDHDFGKTVVVLHPLSEHFSGFDGFLGIDFLKEHPFYLDLEKKKVFFVERAP